MHMYAYDLHKFLSVPYIAKFVSKLLKFVKLNTHKIINANY